MRKRFRLKSGLYDSIPNLSPEIEVIDTVVLRVKDILFEIGYGEEDGETRIYYYDKYGNLFPKAYLDVYYEEFIE
jgi:hypothetical protein